MANKAKCPFCNKEVNIICFGNVYLAACCGQLIHFSKDESRKKGPGKKASEKNC